MSTARGSALDNKIRIIITLAPRVTAALSDYHTENIK